jgi:hypothetical protein
MLPDGCTCHDLTREWRANHVDCDLALRGRTVDGESLPLDARRMGGGLQAHGRLSRSARHCGAHVEVIRR